MKTFRLLLTTYVLNEKGEPLAYSDNPVDQYELSGFVQRLQNQAHRKAIRRDLRRTQLQKARAKRWRVALDGVMMI